MTVLKRAKALVWAFAFALMGSQGAAQVCQTLVEIERLETIVRIELENVTMSGSDTALRRIIDRLAVRAFDVSEFETPEPALDQAIDTYAINIVDIYSQLSTFGPMHSARRLLGVAHENALHWMLTLGRGFCLPSAATPPPAGQPNHKPLRAQPPSSGRGLGMAPTLAAVAAMISALSFALYLLIRFARNRARQRVRFSCNMQVKVCDFQGEHVLRIIDISAIGAKLRLTPHIRLSESVTLQIGRKTVAARVVWQNSHYAGVMFRHVLSARRVRRMADGEITRPLPSGSKATGGAHEKGRRQHGPALKT